MSTEITRRSFLRIALAAGGSAALAACSPAAPAPTEAPAAATEAPEATEPPAEATEIPPTPVPATEAPPPSMYTESPMLAERVAGRNLGQVWPTLPWAARASALCELWARAQAVHSVDPELAKAYVRPRSPFYASNPAEAAGQLERLEETGVLSVNQVAILSDVMDRFWAALPLNPFST